MNSPNLFCTACSARCLFPFLVNPFFIFGSKAIELTRSHRYQAIEIPRSSFKASLAFTCRFTRLLEISTLGLRRLLSLCPARVEL